MPRLWYTVAVRPALVIGISSLLILLAFSGCTLVLRARASQQVDVALNGDTPPLPPAVTPGTPDPVRSSWATLNGTVNANAALTTVTVTWGSSSDVYTRTQTMAPSLISGIADTAVSTTIGGLQPATTYYYRIVAASSAGTTVSDEQQFTTEPLPVLELTVTNPQHIERGTKLPVTLAYTNSGDIIAWDTQISVRLPENTTFNRTLSTSGWLLALSPTHVATARADSTYVFPVGNLAPGGRGRIMFVVDVAADAPFGSVVALDATLCDGVVAGNPVQVKVPGSSDALINLFQRFLPTVLGLREPAPAAHATQRSVPRTSRELLMNQRGTLR